MTLDLFSAPAPARPPLWEWMQSLSPEERVWWDAMLERGCAVELVTDRQAEVDRIARARACGLEIIDETTHHRGKRARRLWFRRGHTAELQAVLGRGRPLLGWRIQHLDGSAVLRIAVEPKTVQEMGAYARKKASTTGPRRAMTEAEISLILRLNGCRFSPGSWDKRFVRDMVGEASEVVPLVTERQAEQLPRLEKRYRKQLAAAWEATRG